MSETDVKYTSMRITTDVTEQAKLAGALKGISMMEYVRQVVLAAALAAISRTFAVKAVRRSLAFPRSINLPETPWTN